MDILALLQNTCPTISRKNVRRLSRIIKAMLAMTDRVTMLGLSRWGGKGCSYRTVQRFFGEPIPWVQLFWQFFVAQLYQSDREYILGGDECVVTKSGKQTYGLDHFFSGSLSKVVPRHCDLCTVADRCDGAPLLPDSGGTGHPQCGRESRGQGQETAAQSQTESQGQRQTGSSQR